MLEKTDELVQLIIRSELMKVYIERKERLLKSSAVQEKMNDFLRAKERFEEVRRFGTYHPDYKQVRKEAYLQLRVIEMDEEIAAFKEAERDLEDLFREISLRIAGKVSDSIMVPGGSLLAGGSHCSAGTCASSACKAHAGL